jgi:hypothetical protein
MDAVLVLLICVSALSCLLVSCLCCPCTPCGERMFFAWHDRLDHALERTPSQVSVRAARIERHRGRRAPGAPPETPPPAVPPPAVPPQRPPRPRRSPPALTVYHELVQSGAGWHRGSGLERSHSRVSRV